jgi:dTDP-4-dehydrorhamnose reductase
VTKVLVTGANGLLGQKLLKLLDQEPGVTLVATARTPFKGRLKQGRFRLLDVTKEAEVNTIIDESQPDVVVHTAAMTQVDQCETDREACWLQNVTAVSRVGKASEKAGAHLIHLSTDFIFDGTQGPLDESATPNPLSHYGVSKLASEIEVQKLTTPWTIIRTVLVYGVTPDLSRSNIVLWVKKSLEEGKSIRVVNDQWRTPTLAEDLAMGCWLAASKRVTGIFHVSGDQMMTPYYIAMRTAEHFNLDSSLIIQTNSKEFHQAAARPRKTGFIIDKARKELGFQPHSFAEGLAIVGSQLG